MSRPAAGSTTHTIVGRLQERLSPPLSLTQIVTHSAGQTSVRAGGQVTWHRVSLGLDYQTIFLPLAAPGRSQFRQILLLQLRLPLGQDIQLNTSTSIDAIGEVRYTTFVRGFAYGRSGGSPSGAAAPPRGTFTGYLIHGVVSDTAGQPVAGAALRVDGSLIFSDSRGAFLHRMTRGKECTLEVALDEFMYPGTWAVVSAPSTVRSERASDDEGVSIVLRRLY